MLSTQTNTHESGGTQLRDRGGGCQYHARLGLDVGIWDSASHPSNGYSLSRFNVANGTSYHVISFYGSTEAKVKNSHSWTVVDVGSQIVD